MAASAAAPVLRVTAIRILVLRGRADLIEDLYKVILQLGRTWSSRGCIIVGEDRVRRPLFKIFFDERPLELAKAGDSVCRIHVLPAEKCRVSAYRLFYLIPGLCTGLTPFAPAEA